MPSRYGGWCTECVCVCTHVICSLIMNLFIRSATGISYYVRQIDSTHDVETEFIGYLSATPFRCMAGDRVCGVYVQHYFFCFLLLSPILAIDRHLIRFSVRPSSFYSNGEEHRFFIFYSISCIKFWLFNTTVKWWKDEEWMVLKTLFARHIRRFKLHVHRYLLCKRKFNLI